jgi:hypothetical protein
MSDEEFLVISVTSFFDQKKSYEEIILRVIPPLVISYKYRFLQSDSNNAEEILYRQPEKPCYHCCGFSDYKSTLKAESSIQGR